MLKANDIYSGLGAEATIKWKEFSEDTEISEEEKKTEEMKTEEVVVVVEDEEATNTKESDVVIPKEEEKGDVYLYLLSSLALS